MHWLLLLLVLGVPALAEEPGAGTMHFHHPGGGYQSAIQLEARMHFQVSGLVAKVKLQQSFRNDSPDWVEGEYLFPLPDRAAVNRLRLRIGERTIVGEIKEKQEATKIYQQARDSGRKAGLVEQRRPNLFSNRVANIAPGETVQVELEYLQRIDYDDGLFSLRFPMTITPRFKADPGVWQFQHPVPATQSDPIQAIVISGELDMGLPLEHIVAPHHKLSLQRQQQRYQLKLAAGQTAMDRDFVLNWRPLTGSEPQAAVFHETVAGEEYALLMVVPPRGQEVAALPREIVLVIDTSGSMGGTSIHQARAALAFALEQLRFEDSFNIIEFNNSARALFNESQPASDHNLARAREFVRHLDAGGGTEMRSALELALPLAERDGEQLRQVVFITDGAVGNEAELYREIDRRLQSDRLFTVGIGSAPNSWFMRRAAELGRGQAVFIGDVLEVQQRMEELFKRLSQTLIADFDVHWPTEVDAWPQRLPDLYPGEPLVVAARADSGLLGGTVSVSGRREGQDWFRDLALQRDKSHPGIATVWAREKIAALEDQRVLGRDEAEVRAEALPVALAHQLVSRYTSFVAVEQQPSRLEHEALKRKSVPNLRPKGQTAQTYAWPRTATAAPLQLVLGTILLLLSCVFWHRSRCS